MLSLECGEVDAENEGAVSNGGCKTAALADVQDHNARAIGIVFQILVPVVLILFSHARMPDASNLQDA